MPVPSSNITISSIQTEFGGTAPIGIKEYYDVASGIPASGIISFSQFAGKSRYSRTLVDTLSGTNVTTSNIPGSVYYIEITVVGGGGSGAAGQNITSGKVTTPYGGAGGGGGAFGLFQFQIPEASRGGYFVYTVGAGGAAVTSSADNPVNGQSGGTTTIEYRAPNGTLVATFQGGGGGGGGYVNSGSNTLNNSTRGTGGGLVSSIVSGTIIGQILYGGGTGGGVFDWTGGTGAGSAWQQYINGGTLNINGTNSTTCGGVAGSYGGGYGVGRAHCDGTNPAGTGAGGSSYPGAGGGGVGDGASRTSGAGAGGRLIVKY